MTAHQIAKYFLALQELGSEDVSNLKLQKLIYYAQGYHLGLYRHPLFADTIEAWEHGPVVPEVYRFYKKHGSAPIPIPDDIDFSDDVYKTVGQFSAWRLREMTHEEPPWKEARDTGISNTISQDSMRDYFKTLVE